MKGLSAEVPWSLLAELSMELLAELAWTHPNQPPLTPPPAREPLRLGEDHGKANCRYAGMHGIGFANSLRSAPRRGGPTRGPSGQALAEGPPRRRGVSDGSSPEGRLRRFLAGKAACRGLLPQYFQWIPIDSNRIPIESNRIPIESNRFQ